MKTYDVRIEQTNTITKRWKIEAKNAGDAGEIAMSKHYFAVEEPEACVFSAGELQLTRVQEV